MKRIKYILILIISVSLSGCSDWLDILPKNEQVTANYWKNKEDVEAMLASGYYYMRTTTRSLIVWGELRGASIYAYGGTEEGKLQDFQLTPSTSLSKWDVIYNIINIANSVIEYAPDVYEIDNTYTKEAMMSHQTEAYFMRSLMNFYLVRNFKEAPLALEPYIDDSAPFALPKSSEEVIIAQIKDDIRTALGTNAAKEFYDSDTWKDATKGRVTKWALYALMADVALWSEDYDLAVEYSDYLINATASRRPAFLTIPEDWFTIFNPGNSNESIFELNWDYAGFNQTANSPSNYLKIATNSQFQYSEAMGKRFEAEDNFLFETNRVPVRSQWGAYVTSSEDDSDFKVYNVWKYWGTELNDITATRVREDANFIIYRMADVMLMKAEALIWKGESHWAEALEIINQIRRRANLDDLEVNLADTNEVEMMGFLLHERDIELAAEGKRWYDLLRFGKSKNFKYKEEFIELIIENNSTANSSWIRSVLRNSNAWYLPIAQSEIEANELLEQNPYYAVTK